MAQRVNSLFEKTNSLPHLQEITDDDIMAEIDAYRNDQEVFSLDKDKVNE